MTGRAYDREFPPVRPSPEFVPAHETERRFSSRGWDSSRSSVETGTEILHPATGLRLRVVKIPPTGASGEFGLTHGKRGRCSSHRRESARATGAKPPGAAAGIRSGSRRGRTRAHEGKRKAGRRRAEERRRGARHLGRQSPKSSPHVQAKAVLHAAEGDLVSGARVERG